MKDKYFCFTCAFLKYNFLAVALLLMSCHKEDENHKMERSEFAEVANQLLRNENFLDSALQSLSVTDGLSRYLIVRADQRRAYVEELKTQTYATQNPIGKQVSAEILSMVQQSKNKPVQEQTKKFLEYIVLTDQDWVGLHVKGSGSSGVRDSGFRNWASQRLLLMQERLNNSQLQLQAN